MTIWQFLFESSHLFKPPYDALVLLCQRRAVLWDCAVFAPQLENGRCHKLNCQILGSCGPKIGMRRQKKKKKPCRSGFGYCWLTTSSAALIFPGALGQEESFWSRAWDAQGPSAFSCPHSVGFWNGFVPAFLYACMQTLRAVGWCSPCKHPRGMEDSRSPGKLVTTTPSLFCLSSNLPPSLTWVRTKHSCLVLG